MAVLNTELKDTYEECLAEFRKYERYATEIYANAHQKDWLLAESLLSHTHDEFHDFSILDLAAHGKCQNFLSHPGIWNKVNELWRRPRNGFQKKACSFLATNSLKTGQSMFSTSNFGTE